MIEIDQNYIRYVYPNPFGNETKIISTLLSAEIKDLEDSQAQIIVKNDICIRVKKDNRENTIIIKKINGVFITTNQDYIYSNHSFVEMIDVLLKGFIIVSDN